MNFKPTLTIKLEALNIAKDVTKEPSELITLAENIFKYLMQEEEKEEHEDNVRTLFDVNKGIN